MVPFVPPLGVVALIALPFLYAAYKAIEWRWWVSGLRIGEVRFESTLPRKAFVDLYWKVIGWSVLLLIGLGLYLGLCAKLLSLVSGAAARRSSSHRPSCSTASRCWSAPASAIWR